MIKPLSRDDFWLAQIYKCVQEDVTEGLEVFNIWWLVSNNDESKATLKNIASYMHNDHMHDDLNWLW